MSEGDLRKIRPSIRASEMAENPLAEKDLTRLERFWDEAWENSPCLALMEEKEGSIGEVATISRADVSSLLSEIESHWSTTHSTTAN
ncbi:MAG: hypothetical protein MZV65_02425 [Chromatiales bacterium]|nr:hypothetical protein [Chromatiales bacterium]